MGIVFNGPLQAATDKFGNTIGFKTGGATSRLRPMQGRIRWAIAGDSISEPYNYANPTGVSIVSPGIARATFTGAFQAGTYWPGDAIKVTASPTRNCNQQHSVITAVDPNRLWIEYEVLPERENGVIGTYPNVYRKSNRASASYFSQMCAQIGIPSEIVVDAAMGGGDCEQVLEVLSRDYQDCDAAIYAPGMNCIYARRWAFERIKTADMANLKILRQAPILIILSVPPRHSTNGAWNDERFSVWRKVNEWRRQYAAQIGAVFVDLTAANLAGRGYSDPLNANNDPYNSGVQQTTVDGVHPIGVGGAILGNAVLRPARNLVGSDYLPASIGGTAAEGYVLPNPLMRRGAAGLAAGAATGTATFKNLAGADGAEVADAYTLNVELGGSAALVIKAGVIPRTKSVHGDNAGNAQRIIIDNTANASAATITLRTNSFHAQLVDADILDYGGHILLSDMATPGAGDPAGVTAVQIGFLDQHATALNNRTYLLAADNGIGRYPGMVLSPVGSQATRRVATAGSFTSSAISYSVTVAAGSTACVDIGRALGRRQLAL